MSSRPLPCSVPCFLVLVLLSGCGSSTGQVSGKITLKSRPFGPAELVFRSKSHPDLEFFGVVREDGSYQVSYRTHNGLPVGKYDVTIRRHVLPGGKDLPPGEKGQILIDSGKTVQQAYSFEKDVQAGSNPIDFELSEGKMTIVPGDGGSP